MSTESVLFDLREQAKKYADTDPAFASRSQITLPATATIAAASNSISVQKEIDNTSKESVKEKPSRLLNRAKRAVAVPLSVEEIMTIEREIEGKQLAAFKAITSSTSSFFSSPSPADAVKSFDKSMVNAGKAAMTVYNQLADTISTSASTSASTSTSSASSTTSTPTSISHVSDLSELSVLCRTPQQVTAACQLSYLKEVTLDFLEVHGLREAVQEIKKAGKIAVVATPRIIKPNEERLYTFYLRLKADALLVRSAGFLNQLLELGGAGTVLSNSNITIPDLRGTEE